MKVAALVLAAGRGERLGGDIPKAFVPALGKALVVRSIEAIARVPEVDCVIPVVAPADLERFSRFEWASIPELAAPVAGGEERQHSVAAGLAALPAGTTLVAVHDAARCLVDPEDVSRVIRAAAESGAAILAQPLRDTLKRVRSGEIIETPERSEWWAAQTPQVFRVELLREALAKAEADGILGTDDAQLVERLGAPVKVVEGSPRNFKITLPGDLEIAELWLREQGES